MNSPQKTARIAGLLYLVVVLTGFFSLLYIPSKLVVWDNAATTTTNIITNETLFRLGIVAGIICYIAFLFLPVLLYKLLQAVNKVHAIAMVILAVTSVPISLINLANKFAILTWISKAAYLDVFPAGEIQAQVLLHLHYYNNGIEIASIFWGFWLLPFGYLVYKSGFLPKILGIFLMAGCFGYIINFSAGFLFPAYNKTGISSYISIPSAIGEIGTCLWLFNYGSKEK